MIDAISRTCSVRLSAFVGALIGGVIGFQLFHRPFGMGSQNEDILFGLCALLGAIVGIKTEPRRDKWRSDETSTAWRLGRAIRRAGDYFHDGRPL